MEENRQKDVQEDSADPTDPAPLTDEEFEQYQKKENRKGRIFVDIIDFILDFFR